MTESEESVEPTKQVEPPEPAGSATSNPKPTDPVAPDPTTRVEPSVQPPHDFILGRAQALAVIALITGPASLLIGDIFLGSLGVVCALFARAQINRVTSSDQDAYKELTLKIRRWTTIAALICTGAIIINIISVALIFPMLLEALEAGDYTRLGLSTPIEPLTKTWG